MREAVVVTVRRRCQLLTAVALGFLAPVACGQTPASDLVSRVGIRVSAEGQSGSELRDHATQHLPWSGISPTDRTRIRSVLDDCAQYRRLPELRYAVEPSVYDYLVRHPDVAVSTWRVMGISKVQMWQIGPLEYEATSPDGSEGHADILFRDDSQCLMLCSGTYNSVLIPHPITAKALVWHRYRFLPAAHGQTEVHQQTDVFLAFPSAAARAVAILASPVTNVMMDRNLFEVSLYARMMSQATAVDPDWMEQIAVRMDGVLPQRREELARLVRPAREYGRMTVQLSDPDLAGVQERMKMSRVSAPDTLRAQSPESAAPADSQRDHTTGISEVDSPSGPPARIAAARASAMPLPILDSRPAVAGAPSGAAWKARSPDSSRSHGNFERQH